MTKKAIFLLATLKKEGRSNTQALCEFLIEKMEKQKIISEVIKLVDYTILPGTHTDMGNGDEWPQIYKKILDSDILIFATPVWWGGHSSLMQQVIERLDEVNDNSTDENPSVLEGKVGGIVITGDSDGGEHIIGSLSNFFNALGILLPPYATLSVLSREHSKTKKTSKKDLMALYEEEASDFADTMIKSILKYS